MKQEAAQLSPAKLVVTRGGSGCAGEATCYVHFMDRAGDYAGLASGVQYMLLGRQKANSSEGVWLERGKGCAEVE